MKNLIKQLLREGLDELAIHKKPMFGKGVEHDLYVSEKKPNVLYKIGMQPTVSKWVKVFSSNPSLFPKVYKTGIMKNGMMYAEVERLDAPKAKAEWDYLETALENVGIVDTDVFESTIDQVFISLVVGETSLNGVLKRLSNNPQAAALVKKWVTFLIKVDKYIQKFGYMGLDIHRYNFAYDSTGNIKAIDI